MPYADYGYDNFFNRSLISPPDQLLSLDTDVLLQGISGQSLLASGSISSANTFLELNLDGNSFSVSDGTIERIRLGSFEDGEYGLRIKDQDGNTLMDITGTNNIIQSPDGKLQLDLTRKQLRVYDDTHLRVLLGEL